MQKACTAVQALAGYFLGGHVICVAVYADMEPAGRGNGDGLKLLFKPCLFRFIGGDGEKAAGVPGTQLRS